jgi:lipoyl(octanoyl) transferase
MAHPVIIRERGRIDYPICYAEMQAFTADRTAETVDEIWCVEHPPVYTLGTNANATHLLDAGKIPVHEVDRGGQVTYHGPGQLVVYPLLDLKRAKLGIRDLVCRLERSIVAMLAKSGIDAAGRPGAPGVYVDGAKIASVGLRVRNHCCYHGIAINVSVDLRPFSGINPCGYPGLDVVRTADLGGPRNVAAAARALLPELLRELDLVAAPAAS